MGELSKTMNIAARAMRALVMSADASLNHYDGQTPVEDWALDALSAVVDGDYGEAERLLGLYETAPVEQRIRYVARWHDEPEEHGDEYGEEQAARAIHAEEEAAAYYGGYGEGERP